MSNITELAPKIAQRALEVGQGKLLDGQRESLQIPLAATIEVLSTPQSDWARTVDAIESPFADEYDETEYMNKALALMGLQEMKYVLQALGIPSRLQTAYTQQLLQGKECLDVGCGTGRIVIPLAAFGARVTGFDATAEYVRLTAQKAARELGKFDIDSSNISLYQCLAEDFPYAQTQERYDSITSLFGVLNHVQNWDSTIRNISQSLKSNGTLLLSMYGPNNALVFQQQREGLLPYRPSLLQRRAEGGILLGDSTEVLPAKFPTPEEVTEILKDSDLVVEKVIGFLRIAALFPQNPIRENIEAYKQLVAKIDPKAAQALASYQEPNELLLAAFLYDQINQENINNFAYTFYVARKK